MNAYDASDLKIDWNSKQRLEGRDPYFVWADLTRLRGLVPLGKDFAQYSTLNIPLRRAHSGRQRAQAGEPRGHRSVSLLIEREEVGGSAPKPIDCLRPNALYDHNDRFLTADLRWGANPHDLESALSCSGIEGWGNFELGSAVNFEVDGTGGVRADGSGASGRPLSVPWEARTKTEASSTRVPRTDDESSGEDFIVVIDHGCAFAQPAFLDDDGKTRIAYFWDQDRRRSEQARAANSVWKSVKGLAGSTVYGAELASDDIDRLMAKHTNAKTGVIDEAALYEDLVYDVMRQTSSHGTHVMSLIAGWPDPLRISGLAHTGPRDRAAKAKIIFVQLPRDAVADTSGASMNVAILDAFAYVRMRTKPRDRVTFCLSYGSFSGGHTGRSRIDRAIAQMIQARRGWKLFVAAGNAYEAACHASREVSAQRPTTFEVTIDPDCRVETFVEFWAAGFAEFALRVKPPNCRDYLDVVQPNQTAAWAFSGSPSSDASALCVVNIRNCIPAGACESARQSMLVAIAPTHVPQFGASPENFSDVAAPAGIWTIEVSTNSEENTEVRAWIERDDLVTGELRKGQQARFVEDFLHDPQAAYPSHSSVKRRGSASNLSANPSITSVGAAVAASTIEAETVKLSLERKSIISRYSSVGYADATSQYRTSPSTYDVADQSFAMPGVLAAGNRSMSVSRRNGTSVATPIAARRYINGEEQNDGSGLVRAGLLEPLDEAGNPLISRRQGDSQAVANAEGLR